MERLTSVSDFQQWQDTLKAALDPNMASDPFFYAEPADEE